MLEYCFSAQHRSAAASHERLNEMALDSADYKSPFSLDREMGFSRREFFNLLPKPLAGYVFSIDSNGATIELEKGSVLIQVGDERERRLSDLVRLPILPVKIQFIDVEPPEKARFLCKFDHAYMKGLG